jgi:O-antigen/teichoic acid export membrane protein
MGLAAKSLGTFLTNIGIFFIRFLIGVLIARFLGPEGKGSLYLLITSVMMCATLGSLGLGPAAIYFIGRDRKWLPAILGNLLVVASSMTVAICALGFILLQYGPPDLYSQFSFWMWSIVAFMVPLRLMRLLMMQVLAGTLRIKEINLIELGAIACQLILIVVVVVYEKAGIGGALIATLVSEALAAICFLAMVVYCFGAPSRPDMSLLKALISFGMKTHLANLMRSLSLRLDAFLLTALAANGIQSTGVYSISTSLAELLMFVPESIRLTLFPMVASSSPTEANRLSSQACRHTALLTGIAAVSVAMFGCLLITPLYGNEFSGAVVPLLILLPGTVALAQTDVIRGDLIGRGHPEVVALSALVSLAVTILMDVLLIPRHGILGAAVASTAAYVSEFVVIASYFTHCAKLTWRESFLFRRPDFDKYSSLVKARTRGWFSLEN